MNHKISIEIERDDDDYRACVYVSINGVYVGGGPIGGEPEDNTIYRDYDWIVPLIEKVAATLDVECCVVEKEVPTVSG